jgi:hypothetical protein
LSPQQATEPSLFTPHVCQAPALTVSPASNLFVHDPFAQPLGQVVSLYLSPHVPAAQVPAAL